MQTAQRKVSTRSAPRDRAAAPRRRTRRQLDVLGISLMAVALFAALSLSRPGLGGAVGDVLVSVLRYLFGGGAWAFPALAAYLGVLHLMDREHKPPMDLVAGGAMLTGVALWLTHIMRVGLGRHIGEAEAFSHGGGIVGAAITAMVARVFGAGGSWVVMAAVVFCAVLMIVDLPVHRLMTGAGRRARRGADALSRQASRAAHAVAARRQPPFVDEADIPRLPARPRKESAAPPTEDAPPRALTLRKRSAAEAAPEAGPPPAPAAPPPVPAPRAPVRVRDLSPEKPGATTREGSDYVLPPLDLLNPPAAPPVRDEAEAQATIETLELTLSQFRIDAKVVEVSRGPTVTRFEVILAPGIKVSKIVSLADNLAMALAAIDVRVEAPIPGKSAIGIEVPSRHPALVGLRECLETRAFYEAESPLTFAIGVDVAGQPHYADLTKMPHMLIGGSTNSGKSVCINTLITSILFRARPDEVKLLLIDPKRVELAPYDNIPHLIHPVVKDVKQAAGIFRWAIKEMEARYDLFVKAGARNIAGYNERLSEEEKPLPYIVLVVDELADLMMQQGAEVEGHICRLAQLARATGIHLVIATQRPSVDVITGTIKANIGSRIAFAVASHTDSRTILNMNGAERLIGRGDLLYMPIDASKPTRLQGPFISDKELDRVVEHLRAQGPPEFTATAMTVDSAASSASEGGAEDELFEQAVRLLVNTGHASTSMLQRKFKIGYTRAARLVDIMEEQGIVGPLDGAKSREILINRSDLDILFGNVPPMPSSDDDTGDYRA